MSRYKNEVARLESHVKTLRFIAGGLLLAVLVCGVGWWQAPKNLTVHNPPDLRSGSTRKWWEVPPESVYAFSFYIFQQLNRWPTDGEKDYASNIFRLKAYLTPSCKAFLDADFKYRLENGELRKRSRGVYEIPGRGYGDDPAYRVKVNGTGDWIVNLDLTAEEYFGSERVKKAFARYPLHVVRYDIDPELNPYGMALDCYSGSPERIQSQAEGPADKSTGGGL